MTQQTRLRGRPTSSNGASSFHAHWGLPGVPLRAISAVLEITGPPSTDALYFWALQASFRSRSTPRGAGHIGLQHHPAYPGAGAVNWGGYHDRSSGGGVLGGSPSELSSTLGNPNTFDYPWRVGRSYRLEIAAGSPGRWRGTVTDLTDGSATLIRELAVDADHLASPVVWSEVFADCDAPPVEVRWSSLAAATTDGRFLSPTSIALTYQSENDGGCSNTSTTIEDGWLVQRTATKRVHQHGERLTW